MMSTHAMNLLAPAENISFPYLFVNKQASSPILLAFQYVSCNLSDFFDTSPFQEGLVMILLSQ